MEAFAAQQSEKRKRAKAAELSLSAKAIPRRSRADEVKLSVDLGFAAPPMQVFAAGKNQCAAVWWLYSNMEGVVAWEVHRYRRDPSKDRNSDDSWQHKGLYSFTDLVELQVNVNELTNDCEYRFTVKAVNAKGPGIESPPSNAVVVEAPLPGGWYRFRDAPSGQYYYASVKTNRSSWTRPELDPFFVDDSLFVHFAPHELQHLRDLFTEDMAHFQHVSFAQFGDALRECGERVPGRQLKRLFKAYVDNVTQLDSWTQFVEIMTHIKRLRTEKTSLWTRLVEFVTRTRARRVLRPQRDKLGPWRLQFSELAERFYYAHSGTGETSWLMPDDVKFYLPPPLRTRLLRVFAPADLDEFRQYFSLLDVDSSGDLSDEEIRLLLEMMGVSVTPAGLRKLIKAIDMNRNGTVEFDEFCWMMYELRRRERMPDRPTKRLGLGLPTHPEREGEADDEAEGGEQRDEGAEGWDDEEDKSLRRPNAFGSAKWNSVTFGAMRSAVFHLRSRDATSMQPDAPMGPDGVGGGGGERRASMSRTKSARNETARNTAMNSVQTLPAYAPLWKRALCCGWRAGSGGYVLQVRPVDSDVFPSSPMGSPGTRSSFAEARSAKSLRSSPLMSPSGKEYRLQQEFVAGLDDVVEAAAPTSKKAAPPRADPRLTHGPHCFCGCRGF